MTGYLLSLAAAVAAAVLYGVASVLQASGAHHGTSVAALIRSPAYLLGLGGDAAAWLLSLLALRHLPLFAVQSVLAGSLAVTAVLGLRVLAVALPPADIASIAALIAALTVLALCGGDQPAPVEHGPVRLALLLGLPVLAVLLPAFGRAGPLGLAVLAGLAFSGAALGARVVEGHPATLAHHPLSYAVIGYGLLGIYAYAQALEHGSVTVMTAALWTVEVLVPTVVGLTALGDTVRPGWWPWLLVSVAVVLVATLRLARSDPAGHSGARPAAPPARPDEI